MKEEERERERGVDSDSHACVHVYDLFTFNQLKINYSIENKLIN